MGALFDFCLNVVNLCWRMSAVALDVSSLDGLSPMADQVGRMGIPRGVIM